MSEYGPALFVSRVDGEPLDDTEQAAILDKINEEGFQSLTAEEKKMLEKSSKKLSKKIDGDK